MAFWNAERTRSRIDEQVDLPSDPYAMVDPHGPFARARRRRAVLPVLGLAIAVVAVAVGLTAYGELRPPAIEAYADQTITLRGLGEEDVLVSVRELAALECINLAAESDGRGEQGESKAGRVEAYGPTLETLLARYDAKQTDFSRIVVSCLDGYDIALHGDSLEGQIVVSIAQGKDALDEWHWPARLVIPSESSGMWCYGVEIIDFQKAPAKASESGGMDEDRSDAEGEEAPSI